MSEHTDTERMDCLEQQMRRQDFHGFMVKDGATAGVGLSRFWCSHTTATLDTLREAIDALLDYDADDQDVDVIGTA